jgi:hypothetical protein
MKKSRSTPVLATTLLDMLNGALKWQWQKKKKAKMDEIHDGNAGRSGLALTPVMRPRK